jgi:Asp-tRNA(Asn)/Glu-tRNA(Gln) amidotransferase A subunit family amidase
MKMLKSLTLEDHIKAISDCQQLAQKVGKFFEKFGFLLTPVMGITAWKAGLSHPYVKEINGEPLPSLGETLLTYPFNITCHPAVSVPVGWTKDGLPVGLQIVGK